MAFSITARALVKKVVLVLTGTDIALIEVLTLHGSPIELLLGMREVAVQENAAMKETAWRALFLILMVR